MIVYILVDEEEYRAHGGKKSFEKVKHKVDHKVIADTEFDVVVHHIKNLRSLALICQSHEATLELVLSIRPSVCPSHYFKKILDLSSRIYPGIMCKFNV